MFDGLGLLESEANGELCVLPGGGGGPMKWVYGIGK